MCSFPICLASFRSECPSQQYVSLQCSRKKMLFLLTVACGGGMGRRGGASPGARAGLGAARRRGLASRLPEGPPQFLSLTSAQRLSGLWVLGGAETWRAGPALTALQPQAETGPGASTPRVSCEGACLSLYKQEQV